MPKPDEKPETLPAPDMEPMPEPYPPPGWTPPEEAQPPAAETLPELPEAADEAPAHPQPHGLRRAPEPKGRARAHKCEHGPKSRPVKSFYFSVDGVPKQYGQMGADDLANAKVVPVDVDRTVTEARLPPGRVREVRFKLGPFVERVHPWTEGSCGHWSYVVEDGVAVVTPEIPPGAELEVDVEEGGADG